MATGFENPNVSNTVLVDTPGFNDTKKTGPEVLEYLHLLKPWHFLRPILMISSSLATPTCAIGKNQFSLSPNVVLRLFQTSEYGRHVEE